MKQYLVIDLPPHAVEATRMLNDCAAQGWEVKTTLYVSRGDASVIMEREPPGPLRPTTGLSK